LRGKQNVGYWMRAVLQGDEVWDTSSGVVWGGGQNCAGTGPEGFLQKKLVVTELKKLRTPPPFNTKGNYSAMNRTTLPFEKSQKGHGF